MFALARTRWGFRLKMLGMNPNAARAAGVSMAAVGGGALVMSGAFAGLAGGVVFAGTAFRIQPGYSANIGNDGRSEEHTSELQSLMRISYAVFCLKKKNDKKITQARLTTTTKTYDINTEHKI